MGTTNEDAVIPALERAHEMAMSKNSREAAAGRLAKEVVNLTERWLRSELSRARTPDDLRNIVVAAAGGAASLLTSALFTVFHGQPPAGTIEDAATLLGEMIRDAPNRFAEQHERARGPA